MQLAMDDRTCPVCGSADESRVVAAANADPAALDAFAFASRKVPEYMHWRLVECPACDLLRSTPAPRPDSLGALYDEAAFDSGPEAAYAARTYGRLLPRIARRVPDKVGALDVGTGDGVFLRELLAAGFTGVVGVEPSAAPVAAAAADLRPLIRHDIFRAEQFAPASLSAITCFQTIEHLPDPLAMCRDATRLLKPGGALLLIGHNRRATANRLMGRKSPIYDIEHLQLFSPASLREMMNRAGLVDVEVGTVLNRYPISYWTRLLPIPRGPKQAMIGAMNAVGVGRIAVPLPAGNLYAIGYKAV